MHWIVNYITTNAISDYVSDLIFYLFSVQVFNMVNSLFLVLFSWSLISIQHICASFYTPPSPEDNIFGHQGVGIWEFPSGCEDDCKQIRWHVVGSNLMMFNLTTYDTDYFAVAISADSELDHDDDAYICYYYASDNSAGVYSGYITKQGQPTPLNFVESGKVEKVGRRLTCTFYRPMSVTKSIYNKEMTWDIAINPYNLIYVEGDMKESTGQFIPYTYTAKTNKAFDLHRSQRYLPLSAKTILKKIAKFAAQQPVNLSVEVNPIGKVFAINSTYVVGRWNISNQDCPNGKRCKYIQWQKSNKGMISFAFHGSSAGWIAMAISPDDSSEHDEVYICARSSPGSGQVTLSSAYFTRSKVPIVIPQMSPKFSTKRIKNGGMICAFSRKINLTTNFPGYQNSRDLSKENFYLFYAEGEVGEDGQLLPYTFSARTHGKLAFLNITSYELTKSTKPKITRTTKTTTNDNNNIDISAAISTTIKPDDPTPREIKIESTTSGKPGENRTKTLYEKILKNKAETTTKSVYKESDSKKHVTAENEKAPRGGEPNFFIATTRGQQITTPGSSANLISISHVSIFALSFVQILLIL